VEGFGHQGVRKLMKRLGLCRREGRRRPPQGHARRWVVWADEAELERLRQLHELPRGYHTHMKWIELQRGDDRVPR
jgi:hypothetical protein